MSSFEDIYQRVLQETSAETVYDRIFYLITNRSTEVRNILYPFLQVIPDKIYHEWYDFIQSEQSPMDIITMTKKIVHVSTTNIYIRRIIDLLLIKINN
jgi:hypothetical protein